MAELSSISQPDSFRTVKLGDTVTIGCQIKREVEKIVWQKLTTGKRLQNVATTETFYRRNVVFDQFNHRYSVTYDNINSYLTISNTTWEDIGTYYCGALNINQIQFGQGTFLMLQGI